jgi:hypothetical protein
VLLYLKSLAALSLWTWWRKNAYNLASASRLFKELAL